MYEQINIEMDYAIIHSSFVKISFHLSLNMSKKFAVR